MSSRKKIPVPVHFETVWALMRILRREGKRSGVKPGTAVISEKASPYLAKATAVLNKEMYNNEYKLQHSVVYDLSAYKAAGLDDI